LSYYSDHQREIDEHIEKNKIPENLIHPSAGSGLQPES